MTGVTIELGVFVVVITSKIAGGVAEVVFIIRWSSDSKIAEGVAEVVVVIPKVGLVIGATIELAVWADCQCQRLRGVIGSS